MSAARAFVLPALLFVLAAWLGRLGGAILAAASAPPPLHEPHPTCEQSLALKKEHAQLAERAQQLARALVDAGSRPVASARPFDVTAAAAALQACTPAPMRLIHCAEYPCVAVFGGDASGVLACEGLSFAPQLVATAPTGSAVALLDPEQPPPARLAPRAASLLEVSLPVGAP